MNISGHCVYGGDREEFTLQLLSPNGQSIALQSVNPPPTSGACTGWGGRGICISAAIGMPLGRREEEGHADVKQEMFRSFSGW